MFPTGTRGLLDSVGARGGPALGALLICLLAACGGNVPAAATPTPAPTIAATAAPTIAPTTAPTLTSPAPTLAPTAAAAATVTTVATATSPVELLWKINGDPNKFNSPAGLALDPQGNLYVTDAGNNRIQKFDSNGRFITKWGSFGSGDGQFGIHESTYGAAAVDGQGNVYVPDNLDGRIQKFDSNGKFLAAIGSRGLKDGQLSSPIGVAVDHQGDVFVTDYGGELVVELDPNGKFLAKWGGSIPFSQPGYLAVDGYGNVYVPDMATNTVQKFDSHGRFLARWDTCGSGQYLHGVLAVAVDVQGDMYVTDYGNHRVCKYDAAGGFLNR